MDLIDGQVQVSFVSLPAAMPHVKTGRIRALAVTGPKRSQIAPALPTVAEAGLGGYAAEQWYGVLAPRATARAIVARLNRDFAWALAQPDTRERLLDSGYDIATDTSEEGFSRFIRNEIAKWAEVIGKRVSRRSDVGRTSATVLAFGGVRMPRPKLWRRFA
jgi:tripartite-type tricarboxylate transporter receptor subunit TctC